MKKKSLDIFQQMSGMRYALFVFVIWTLSPIILASFVYLLDKALINPYFLGFLFIKTI